MLLVLKIAITKCLQFNNGNAKNKYKRKYINNTDTI